MALALGATAIVAAAPADAQSYGYRSHRGSDAGPAIIAGIAGLAIGAAVASSSNRNRSYDREYDGYDRGYDGYERRYDQDSRRGYYKEYREDYGQNGYGYQQGYDSYDRGCTVQRTWDRYSQRSVLVRVCR